MRVLKLSLLSQDSSRQWSSSSRSLPVPSSASARNTLLALIVMAAGPAAGQSQTSVALFTGSTARADALHERAAALLEAPTRYTEASRLLRQAAALRDELDDRATEELLLAGRLSYYAGDWDTAQRTLEQGGKRALDSGQLSTAANAYVDAAFCALARKDRDDTFGFVRRAQRLAGSPYFDLEERHEILGRIGPVRVALAAAGR